MKLRTDLPPLDIIEEIQISEISDEKAKLVIAFRKWDRSADGYDRISLSEDVDSYAYASFEIDRNKLNKFAKTTVRS